MGSDGGEPGMYRLLTAGLWVLGLAVGGAGPALAQEGWAGDWWEQATPASVQEWLDRGADLHARDVADRTPLHWAARYNANPTVAAVLLDRGADLTARASGDGTPLHSAAFNTNPAVLALLLDRGADLHARAPGGGTPLHEAAAFNTNPAVLALLLDRGADATLRDRQAHLPGDFADMNPDLRGTAVYQRLTAASAGADAAAQIPLSKRVPPAENMPFIQAFRQAETRAQKLQHLRSWHRMMGMQNGLPEFEALHFESLLDLLIFSHIDDTGMLNCQALGENLDLSMYGRYELETSTYGYSLPYTMFNLIVDALCPALAGESPHRRREQ